MPWTVDRYPAPMKNLPPAVREKAIEIANALLDAGMDEGMAIRVAIAKAMDWAKRHENSKTSKSPLAKAHPTKCRTARRLDTTLFLTTRACIDWRQQALARAVDARASGDRKAVAAARIESVRLQRFTQRGLPRVGATLTIVIQVRVRARAIAESAAGLHANREGRMR